MLKQLKSVVCIELSCLDALSSLLMAAKGRTINDLGGGLGQRIRVEFFFSSATSR